VDIDAMVVSASVVGTAVFGTAVVSAAVADVRADFSIVVSNNMFVKKVEKLVNIWRFIEQPQQ